MSRIKLKITQHIGNRENINSNVNIQSKDADIDMTQYLELLDTG